MEVVTDSNGANRSRPKTSLEMENSTDFATNWNESFQPEPDLPLATSGNLIIFRCLFKGHRIKQSRFSLLLLHLTMADLIVCFTVIPTEVFWRLTIQWRGGWQLCKLAQFSRAFGLYLSSLVLMCCCLDRCFAVMSPLKSLKRETYSRTKFMLVLAWITAAVFSLPQAVFFSLESHPEFPSFKQCVTKSFFNSYRDLEIYTILSVAVMYFLPLVVILCTYSAILTKIVRKSRDRLEYNANFTANNFRDPLTAISALQELDIVSDMVNNSSNCVSNRSSTSAVRIRCSINAGAKLSKAVSRTIRTTVVILTAFVVCWTPYAVMVLWYMIDWTGAEQVDPLIQEALFLMAVANSCVNPIINGSFAYKNRRDTNTRV